MSMSEEFDQENCISGFVVEVSDGMAVLTKALHPADGGLPTPPQLHEQVIVAHRIRGAAVRYRFEGVTRLCDRLEAMLEQAANIPDAEWPPMVDALREAVQGIQELMHAAGIGKREEQILPTKETVVSTSAQPSHLSDGYFLPELDPEVVPYFVPEAQGYLEKLEVDLLRLDNDTRNGALINQLFRTAHTLKGSAYTVGFQAIGDLVHHVEDFLGAVRDSRLSVLPGHTDAVLRAIDIVRVLLRRDPSIVHLAQQRFESALSELKQLEQGHPVEATPMDLPGGGSVVQVKTQSRLAEGQEQAGKQAEGKPGEEREVIRVSYARLEQLMNLVGELIIERGRLEQRLRALEQLSEQVLSCKTRLVNSIQSFADKHTVRCQSEPSGPADPATPHGWRGCGDVGTLQLDTDDDCNILARRIGEVSADITESMAQLNRSIRVAQDDMNQLEQVTRKMRDEIGRARMVPVGTPFTRFRRAIREIARALNKEASLVTSGEQTEVDTGIVERLVDPLIHLVRNAVYHGIELPVDRVAKGKMSIGTVYLHAAHRGNSIVIEVEDDGAGLDLAKIREKAVKGGFAQPDQIRAMPDTEVLQYIFWPGFSTADTIGDQAGRGVGLDVVKRAVEGMNGHIEVESRKDVGTKFILSLPLSLPITTALLVRAGSEQYAFVLSDIREVTLPTATSLTWTEGRTLLRMDEDVIEVRSLWHTLRGEPSCVGGTMPVVIVRTAAGFLGLAVDELLGRQEIVIKSLGSLKPFEDSYFGGATIDPEGRVVLVVDPGRLGARQSVQSAA
jgi:chemosensory pili system protein ChpA (sensor histidine kinase/response regulator)